MYLYREGNHYDIYKKLGAHLTEINGHAGVTFAVWAPNAQRISIVGDFNGWDGRCHPMRKRVESGIWEIFIPGVVEGTHYKLEVRNCFRADCLEKRSVRFLWTAWNPNRFSGVQSRSLQMGR